jgi:hypothetical protein
MGKKYYGNLKVLKVAFGEQAMGRTQVSEWLPSSKQCVLC